MPNNFKIYEVGGSIRNELLGIKPKDRDYVVMAPSYDAMKDYLLAQGAKIYQERPQYLNIKAKHPELGAVDFTIARKDGFYSDARRPDATSITDNLEEDLARRDFRMNAIAREVGTNVLIDPFNGQEDIRNKKIQTVGNPYDRFGEDRLRIFRAIRFAGKLGFFLSNDIEEAIHKYETKDFDVTPAEMIQKELWDAFAENTYYTFNVLHRFPTLISVMVLKGIRLKPTLEK